MNAADLLNEVVNDITKVIPVKFGDRIDVHVIMVYDENDKIRGHLYVDIGPDDTYVSYEFYGAACNHDNIGRCWYKNRDKGPELKEVQREFVEAFVKIAERSGIITYRKQYNELLRLIEELYVETPHLTGKGAEYLKQLRVHLANVPGGSEYEKARERFEKACK